MRPAEESAAKQNPTRSLLVSPILGCSFPPSDSQLVWTQRMGWSEPDELSLLPLSSADPGQQPLEISHQTPPFVVLPAQTGLLLEKAEASSPPGPSLHHLHTMRPPRKLFPETSPNFRCASVSRVLRSWVFGTLGMQPAGTGGLAVPEWHSGLQAGSKRPHPGNRQQVDGRPQALIQHHESQPRGESSCHKPCQSSSDFREGT